MKKFRWGKFLFSLLLVFIVLGGIVLGGYFVLDKIVVPKYFSEYGISSMSDLVGMMRTLYSTPHESQIVTNGYSSTDLDRAIAKLTGAGYPILEDGSFDFDGFNSGAKGSGDIALTDRELAAVLDKLLDTTEFSDLLPSLTNFNTLNLNLLEITITPVQNNSNSEDENNESAEISASNAHIKFILKIDTDNVRSLMAEQMQIPIFLLNMIVPNTIYVTVNYNVEISSTEDATAWLISDGGMAVNGRSETQSEILLNLLIKFIFGDDSTMTAPKLISELGTIIEKGVYLFGEVEFVSGLGTLNNQNGIYFLPTNINATE